MENLFHKIEEQHPEPQQVGYGAGKKAKLVIFDLDGTLTASKMEMDAEMALLIEKLLEKRMVAVIGGGKYEQFQKQLLTKLEVPKELFKNFFLFPTSGASFYRHNDQDWEQVYMENLSEEEKKRIFEAFEKTFQGLNYSHPEKVYGEIVEDRETQVTFSALGQEAPVWLKEEWNKEYNAERLKMAEMLQETLPDLEVRIGGLTSIDVTRKGIDKEYGIRQIKKHLGVDFDEMLFVGDALFHGGNDSAVLRTGVPCFEVKGPEETKKLIRDLLD
ncbi:MAG: HAD-IIB family hydrolase [Candidatus Taylorbacteria bacterium]|nr:HAD-IIB family hydrolase [Candidatus Taylorbacteria bacterium]